MLNRMCVRVLSCVQLFATLWTVAPQAPLSIEFSRQEYWSGLPFPYPGDLLNPRIKPVSSALASGFFTTSSMAQPQRFSDGVFLPQHVFRASLVSFWSLSPTFCPPQPVFISHFCLRFWSLALLCSDMICYMALHVA